MLIVIHVAINIANIQQYIEMKLDRRLHAARWYTSITATGKILVNIHPSTTILILQLKKNANSSFLRQMVVIFERSAHFYRH